MDPATITIASLSLIASSVAIVMAFRAAEKAERSIILARETAEIVAKSVAAGAFNEKPTNEERIAYARGHIEACKGAELALADHANEFGAALLLAQYRAHAARAKHDLRLLGIES